MLEQGKGSIINFTSIAGLGGLGRGNSAYSASKAAIIGYTRELAIEWAKKGVRVNCIAPCQFWSPGQEKLAQSGIWDFEQIVKTWNEGIPVGRMGRSEEMVAPALFLASDASVMVTGIVLPVDGGYTAR